MTQETEIDGNQGEDANLGGPNADRSDLSSGEDEFPLWIYIVAGVGGCCCLLLLIGMIAFVRRRNKRQSDDDSFNDVAISSMYDYGDSELEIDAPMPPDANTIYASSPLAQSSEVDATIVYGSAPQISDNETLYADVPRATNTSIIYEKMPD